MAQELGLLPPTWWSSWLQPNSSLTIVAAWGVHQDMEVLLLLLTPLSPFQIIIMNFLKRHVTHSVKCGLCLDLSSQLSAPSMATVNAHPVPTWSHLPNPDVQILVFLTCLEFPRYVMRLQHVQTKIQLKEKLILLPPPKRISWTHKISRVSGKYKL